MSKKKKERNKQFEVYYSAVFLVESDNFTLLQFLPQKEFLSANCIFSHKMKHNPGNIDLMQTSYDSI